MKLKQGLGLTQLDAFLGSTVGIVVPATSVGKRVKQGNTRPIEHSRQDTC